MELSALRFRRQVQVGFEYKGATVDWAYRIDILVEEQIILELKSIDRLEPVHQAQVMTYLKIAGYPIGLLINFNVPSLRQGIRRLTLRTPQL